MKNYKMILAMTMACVMLLCTLSGCTKKYSMENTYVANQDSQYMYGFQLSGSKMAESEKGYYFLSGHYLYYADKSSMKPVILCNKPNCLHNDETNETKTINCNACFPNAQSIAYFNGNIYIVADNLFLKTNQNTELIMLSADNTTRKQILEFEFDPGSLTIHRGKVYYTSLVYKKDGSPVYGISEFDLDNPTRKPKKLYEGVLSEPAININLCYGNNLYFNEFGLKDKKTTENTFRIDLKNGKVSPFIDKKNDNDFIGSMTVLNDKLQYSYGPIDLLTGKCIYSKNYKSNLDGSNAVESFQEDLYTNLFSDGKYLFMNDLLWRPDGKPQEEKCLKIADENGNVYATIKTGHLSRTANIVPGGNQHFFH